MPKIIDRNSLVVIFLTKNFIESQIRFLFVFSRLFSSALNSPFLADRSIHQIFAFQDSFSPTVLYIFARIITQSIVSPFYTCSIPLAKLLSYRCKNLIQAILEFLTLRCTDVGNACPRSCKRWNIAHLHTFTFVASFSVWILASLWFRILIVKQMFALIKLSLVFRSILF